MHLTIRFHYSFSNDSIDVNVYVYHSLGHPKLSYFFSQLITYLLLDQYMRVSLFSRKKNFEKVKTFLENYTQSILVMVLKFL